jgi:hypothetical protein
MTQKLKWRMKGRWIKNCSCNSGCPCDFWAEPTHHKCEGMLGMIVDEGYFGDTSLNGVKFVVTYKWPGPLHEGNGTVQPFFDQKMSAAQRDAVGQILLGKAGNMWFEVVASLVSTVLEPKIAPIQFEHDMKNVRAKVIIPGILETVTEPIKNIKTGDYHRISVQLPNGMEYKTAETGSAVVNKGMGDIKYNWPNSHSSLAQVDQTQDGLKA